MFSMPRMRPSPRAARARPRPYQAHGHAGSSLVARSNSPAALSTKSRSFLTSPSRSSMKPNRRRWYASRGSSVRARSAAGRTPGSANASWPTSESRSAVSAERTSDVCAAPSREGATTRQINTSDRQARRRTRMESSVVGSVILLRARPTIQAGTCCAHATASRSEVCGESHVYPALSGGGLGEAEPQSQGHVVTDREIADQLGAHRAQPVQAGGLPGIPGVAGVAEQDERDLVRAERQVAERSADEGERDAILDRDARHAPAVQRAAVVATDREGPRPAHGLSEPDIQRSRRYAAHREPRGDRPDARAGRDPHRENRCGEAQARS